jgi:hypothetical protein
MVFASQGLQDSARRFNAGNIRSVVSWRLSVVRENLRFANGTKITAVWDGLCPAGACRTQPDVSTPGRFSVRGIHQGKNNRPERIEDWSHQLTLLPH